MSAAHLARARQDIGKRLRRDLFFLSPLGIIALALAYGLYFDGWLHGQPGRMRHTTAEVTEVGPMQEDGEVEVRFIYLDLAGEPREAVHEYDVKPKWNVGDVVDFTYAVGQVESAAPVTAGDRLQRRLLAGILGLVVVCFLALLVFCVRRFGKRRYLLRHGRREPGQGAQIESTQFTIKGTTGRMWRLHVRRFDPEQATWTDCRSDWQPGEGPELTAETELPPILLDPRDPTRYWLPTGALAPDHFWKA